MDGRMVANNYIEQRDGGYYIAGTRVALDGVIYEFLRGESPDAITEAFPTISLEQVFGVLAFYLANRDDLDRYLEGEKAEFTRMREEARRRNPALYAKLDAARQTPLSRRT